MRATPYLLRLKYRIRNHAAAARDLRDFAALANGSRLARGYVLAGAQRDGAKLKVDARAAQLAYAFLRLRPYRMVEAKCVVEPHWGKVSHLIQKYSDEEPGVVLQRFAEWRDSEDTKLSEQARETLRARWLARREQRADVSSMVDRAAALAHDGG